MDRGDVMSPKTGRQLGEGNIAINVADLIKGLVDSGIKLSGSLITIHEKSSFN